MEMFDWHSKGSIISKEKIHFLSSFHYSPFGFTLSTLVAYFEFVDTQKPYEMGAKCENQMVHIDRNKRSQIRLIEKNRLIPSTFFLRFKFHSTFHLKVISTAILSAIDRAKKEKTNGERQKKECWKMRKGNGKRIFKQVLMVLEIVEACDKSKHRTASTKILTFIFSLLFAFQRKCSHRYIAVWIRCTLDCFVGGGCWMKMSSNSSPHFLPNPNSGCSIQFSI